jgi:D-alanyl-lipoteichoic acid acyltransferase DltB (MBOAT superfamily)
MNFTSNIFLIGLLPWFMLLIYLTRNQKYSKKILLLIANTVFYIWGGAGIFVFACLFSAVVWLFSIIVSKLEDKNFLLFGLIICFTLVPLLAVKYTNVVVPIGISFYTFEAISLLYDIRTQKVKERISLLDVYLYLLFFPTVTSGPIFRFRNFKDG